MAFDWGNSRQVFDKFGKGGKERGTFRTAVLSEMWEHLSQ